MHSKRRISIALGLTAVVLTFAGGAAGFAAGRVFQVMAFSLQLVLETR